MSETRIEVTCSEMGTKMKKEEKTTKAELETETVKKRRTETAFTPVTYLAELGCLCWW